MKTEKSLNLHILKNIVNNNNKVIPLNLRKNEIGNTKYIPSSLKEWNNSIYVFNTNNVKNIPLYNININFFIKSYFNLYFDNKFIFNKWMSRKFNRLSLNKIFVSKAEIKHTNSKAIITIHTYNREKLILLKKIKGLKKSFLKNIIMLLYNYKMYNNNATSKTIKLLLYKELILLRKFKLRLNLNKFKFEENFLYKISKLISKFYNKKVEFNIVNNKSMILNSDIFTKILSLKLKNKNTNVLRIMDIILNKAVLPKINRIKEKSTLTKSINFNLISNKYKNLSLHNIINYDENMKKVLNNLYYNVMENSSESNYTEIYENIFNSIKYKNIGGIRLEVKGRLTKRYRADRALFKVRWKGGLKNIDSSYKKISTMNLRGYLKSNVEYSMITSKRRIGAFAVKGWISGK